MSSATMVAVAGVLLIALGAVLRMVQAFKAHRRGPWVKDCVFPVYVAPRTSKLTRMDRLRLWLGDLLDRCATPAPLEEWQSFDGLGGGGGDGMGGWCGDGHCGGDGGGH